MSIYRDLHAVLAGRVGLETKADPKEAAIGGRSLLSSSTFRIAA
jgi:hypothetical protein